MNDNRPIWLDSVGAFVLCSVTVAFMVVTIGPYFGLHPDGAVDATVAANQNAVVNNVFIATLSFFIGGTVLNRKKDDIINTQASTIAKAQDALAPIPQADKTINLDPGQTGAVHANEAKP